MAADLTEEIGIHDRGLDELLRILTGPAEPAELAGEQEALAMFGASVTPSASVQGAVGRVAGRAAGPGQFATRQLRTPTRWHLRLVAAAAIVLCGGMAAAAYAAALPAPVQHLVHDVFQFAGVPDNQPQPGPGGSGTAPVGQRSTAPGGGISPAPAGAPGAGAPGSRAPAGSATLSAAADSTRIAAGASVVISGQLRWPGHAVTGITMTLLERRALTLNWHVVGSVPTNSAGNGAVAVPAVGMNANFRFVVSGVAVSPDVQVTVVPAVSIAVAFGSGGTTGVVTVSAPYAQRGDDVLLQVSAGGGRWTYLRQGSLTALRRTSFLLSATRLTDDEIRAVLLPTGLHAGSAGPPVAVSPPG